MTAPPARAIAPLDEVFMDMLTGEFEDDIDAVRQFAGFSGTSDQMELFGRSLVLARNSLSVAQAAVLQGEP